ncbi:MAG: hypothetical protein KA141_02910 [Rubrivivax sp.]|nr:hypothetical protein [Rubrivivax sp.]
MPAPTHPRRRPHWPLAPLSLALLGAGLGLGPQARGAGFEPGALADPPTGEVLVSSAPAPDEPLRGNGIQWVLAPWRVGGTLALDARATRLEDHSHTRQGLLMGDVEMVSHVWQPWFIQLRLGLGLVLAHTQGSSQGAGTHGTYGTRSTSVNGRVALQVFPASRFPFELRADVSDSRNGDIQLGSDYRSQRLSVSQAYRPPTGNDHYRLQLDHSRLIGDTGSDTLNTVTATGLRQLGEHAVELGFNLARNWRDGDESHTQLSALTARHSYQPATALQVETLASWNEVRLGNPGAPDSGSDVRQIASFATWRASAGSLVPGAAPPLVAATARWVEARALGGNDSQRVQAVNVSLGASQELSPSWRLSASGNASQLQSKASGASGRSVGAQGVVGWTPATRLWGAWRYAPTASANAGFNRDSGGQGREITGLQASHGVSRDVALAESQQLSFTFSQSAAALHEAGSAPLARSLAHGASLAWQALGEDGSQSYGGLSLSDSVARGASRGRFQFVNLQFSHRAQLSRYASASANVTAQATHNRASELDVFTGQQRDLVGGWQRFYAGSVSLQHLRAFGVPRLRHSLLLGANSQPLERRALGDIDAPRERITASLESRLEYAIGRLDTRLSARVARVDGRVVAGVQARAQRRF